jgi:hypothetical protein
LARAFREREKKYAARPFDSGAGGAGKRQSSSSIMLTF